VETIYRGTVRNVKRKRVPGGGNMQLQQNYENQSMCGHVGQPTNYSLMNEVYTRRSVLFQYRVKIGRLSSRDSFVSDAGDLKLDARLDRQPM